jgi:hypothetical protein
MTALVIGLLGSGECEGMRRHDAWVCRSADRLESSTYSQYKLRTALTIVITLIRRGVKRLLETSKS